MRLAMVSPVVVVLAAAVAAAAAIPNPLLDSNTALQVLQRLGLHRGDSIPTVTKAEKLREGDSPVYYIKMPPLPYYYVNHNTLTQHHAHQPAPGLPFKKVDINFMNNGKPTQVYHWPQHSTTPAFWMPPTTTTTTPRPTTTTTTTPRYTKRPWVALNKYFPYNGRPSSVYVYKPQRKINMDRYRQHFFKHFNY
ncbi:uncharacterized protein LOC123518964 [Portunus trituberculatus]|uniref:uncharacterized protein LOC123518964 n=1 Tax=Portunus trituberculatus TaxID=210409 RepID=UPI001E1D0208|nr:uncharacterized protein LOC123518964 [Portunus trituberculatus]